MPDSWWAIISLSLFAIGIIAGYYYPKNVVPLVK
jgi:hypothetical protein